MFELTLGLFQLPLFIHFNLSKLLFLLFTSRFWDHPRLFSLLSHHVLSLSFSTVHLLPPLFNFTLLIFCDIFSLFLKLFRIDYSLPISVPYFSGPRSILSFLFFGGLLLPNIVLHSPVSNHLGLSLLDCVSFGFLLLRLHLLSIILVFLFRSPRSFPIRILVLLSVIPLRDLLLDQLIFNHLFDFFLLFCLNSFKFLHLLFNHGRLRGRTTTTIKSMSHRRRRFKIRGTLDTRLRTVLLRIH